MFPITLLWLASNAKRKLLIRLFFFLNNITWTSAQISIVGSEHIYVGKGTKFLIAEIDSIKMLAPSEIYIIGDAHIEGLSSQYLISYVTDSEEKIAAASRPILKKQKHKALDDKKSKRKKNDSFSVCKVTPCQNSSSSLIVLGKKEVCFIASKKQKQNIQKFFSLAILGSFHKYVTALPEYEWNVMSSILNRESIIRPPPIAYRKDKTI